MLTWQIRTAMLLLAASAEPCSISFPKNLWAKQPGTESKLFAFERDGKVGFIDHTGKVVIGPTLVASIDDVGDFSNGRARVERQGYIDETGRFVIHNDYWYLSDFSDGLAQVTLDDPSAKYGKLGLVLDLAGNVVARVPAFHTHDFSEGLAGYEAEGKPGVREFRPGNLIYRDYPGRKGFIDRSGKVVIEPTFADVGPFVDGLARAAVDGYCHLATWENDKQGSPTTGYPSSCGGAPSDATIPCAVGFINPAGSFAIQPVFESAQDFHERLAAVRIGGLWGFIDPAGTVVIPAQFEQTQSFREGLAAVMLDGKWGFIDKAGRVTIPPRFEAVNSFSDSMAIAYKGGRPFYIDRKGQIKIGATFREATSFVHGLAAVLLGENHVAYIDQSGKTVFEYYRK